MTHVATYDINGSKLTLRFGDIAQASTDLIVASDDDELSMGGGTSAAILAKAGGGLKEEAKKHAEAAAIGMAVLSSGHEMPVRYIVHGITTAGPATRSGVPAPSEARHREIVRGVTRSCLDQLDATNASSITFPALGTGYADFPVDETAKVMAREIVDFLDGSAGGLDVEIRLLSSDIDKKAANSAQFVREFSKEVDLGPRLRKTHLVLLVHGIRTFMKWRQPVTDAMVLADDRLAVKAVSYGKFGLPSMLLPRARQGPIDLLRGRIAQQMQSGQYEKLSVVAHSFGTYAVGTAMLQDPSLRLNRLITIGSILPKDFPGKLGDDQIAPLPSGEWIVNEHSFKDRAAWATGKMRWAGFDSPGFDGFAHERVHDQAHPVSHSGYFNKANSRAFAERWATIIGKDEVPMGSPAK